MNTFQLIKSISKQITGTFAWLGHKGCRKVDQILDQQTGKLYELFKNPEGGFSVWETDSDGVSTFWDCGENLKSGQKINLSMLQVGCEL